MTAAAAVAGMAIAAAAPHVRLDADTWQEQLEELLALQSVYGEDFRVLAVPGAESRGGAAGSSPPPLQPPSAGGLPSAGPELDLEEVLRAGPPLEVLSAGGGGASGDDAACGGGASTSGGGGGATPSMGCFVAEALVHVEVPEGGLQLVLELKPPPAPPPPAPPLPPPPPPPPPPLADAAAAGVPAEAVSVVPAAGGGGGGDPLDSQSPNNDGWTEICGKRGGGRGGGRGVGGRGGGGRCGGGSSGWQDAGPVDGGGRGGGSRGESSRGRGPGVRQGARVGSLGGGGGAPYAASGGVAAAAGRDHEGWGREGGRGRGRGRGSPNAGESGRGHGGGGVGGRTEQRLRAASGAAAAAAAAGGGPVDAPGKAGPAELTPGAGGCPPPPSVQLDDDSVVRPVADLQSTVATPAPAEPAAPPAPAAPLLVPFGASVQFLSPIRVTLTLPADYPAVSPPAVELKAVWMTPGQAAALVSELRAQWAAGGAGAPALFMWLEWLKTESLSHLGIQEQLVLGTHEPWSAGATGEGAGAGAAAAGGGGGGGGGGAAVAAESAALDPERVAISLVRYSARREHEKFNESTVSCAICLDEQLGARCVQLPECRDAFCSACLATHLRTQLAGGAVDNMRCPQPSCRRQLSHFVLQQLLSPEEYQRWEALTLQRTLDKMEDLVYCPRCRGPCLEDRDHCTLCPGCFFSFCSLCEDSWHPGSQCLDAESRLALVEQRRASAAADGSTAESATERARREINRLNELKSLALLKNTTQQCPICCMGVEKIEGCNKMSCSYCGAYFCWRCNKVIAGYDHFGNGSCVLFEQDEVDRWNARWNARWNPGPQGARALEVEMRGAMVGMVRQNDRLLRQRNCVVCGQRNIKEGGNNDIRCWACNSHFCYLCRTWLRTNPGAHFGPGRCRQHTDD